MQGRRPKGESWRCPGHGQLTGSVQADTMQRKREDANASRLVMEQQLIEVIASIPAGPKPALQQFQAEKLAQLTRSNVPIQSLEQQQVQNAFNNLPDAEQRALEHRAGAAFKTVVSSAYDKLRQVTSPAP